MLRSLRLPHYSSHRYAFFCCDLQERFSDKIPQFSRCVKVANTLSSISQLLDIPFLVTEQYPQGLGGTVKEITLPPMALVLPKTGFSMLSAATGENVTRLQPFLQKENIIVLFGIEAHVCVLQTALELNDKGVQCVVLADAVGSMQVEDQNEALQLMRTRLPCCTVTTSQSLVFQMVQDAADPNFKTVSKLFK